MLIYKTLLRILSTNTLFLIFIWIIIGKPRSLASKACQRADNGSFGAFLTPTQRGPPTGNRETHAAVGQLKCQRSHGQKSERIETELEAWIVWILWIV